ncbi:hypothetical protein BT63DRAFT_457612 [Microthyrium microscopicum]|uniref:Uncharacterized protein n=1 Tax=Microthyrium microscopicum TaxID=703497 RepID=A0A6A6U6C3_9PEZI|nr:hypothetical protein BT63DRAFT_457612 [Microthyrium microscopicum]
MKTGHPKGSMCQNFLDWDANALLSAGLLCWELPSHIRLTAVGQDLRSEPGAMTDKQEASHGDDDAAWFVASEAIRLLIATRGTSEEVVSPGARRSKTYWDNAHDRDMVDVNYASEDRFPESRKDPQWYRAARQWDQPPSTTSVSILDSMTHNSEEAEPQTMSFLSRNSDPESDTEDLATVHFSW